MNKTYNAGAYGIPAAAFTQVCDMDLKLTWSAHAKQAVLTDRYGLLPADEYPKRFLGMGNAWQLVEAEVNPQGNVVKFVVRREVDHRSVVLVILRDGPHAGIVKTFWINLTDDCHQTLDLTKFSRP